MDHIEKLSEDITRQFRKPSLEPEVAASVREFLQEVGIERHNILRDDAYEDFALSYLKREVAKFRSDEMRPDIDGDREDKLCHCSDSDCPLKLGELPSTVRNAKTIDKGIIQFKREHTGYPAVLDEISEAWAAKCQYVEDSLSTALIAMNQSVVVEELPDSLLSDEPEDATMAEAV